MLRIVRAAVAAAMLVLLAGCASGSGPGGNAPAGHELERSLAALREASSVHVVGDTSRNDSIVKLDVRMLGNGDAQGTVTTDGVPVELVRVSGTTYVRGRDFWSQSAGPEAARTYGDSWVALSGPAGSELAPAFDSVGIRALADDLSERFGKLKGAKVTDGGEVNGSAVTKVQAGQRSVLVRTDSPPYPVRMTAPGITLELRDYNAEVRVSPPQGAVEL